MLHTRCDAALREARDGFERTLTVLREENSTLRRMLEAANARADEQATALMKSLVVTATPLVSVPPAGQLVRRPTSRDPIQGLGNVLDPIPFDHPESIFSNELAASLMVADEPDAAQATA